MNLGAEICYRWARWAHRRQPQEESAPAAPRESRAAYQAWREEAAWDHFLQHFSPALLENKDVVDFGCGGGEMAFFMANNGARSVKGIEVSESQYEIAVRNREQARTRVPVDLVYADRTDIVPLPDESCDVMVCFDVLEHILDYREIFAEWARVMRPGGRVLIWWIPFYHPYGHHLHSTLPLPWAHVVFSDKTLMRACAKIYNDPDFTPPFWDLDADGNKRPDKWREEEISDLNRLTIRRFEEMIPGYGFTIDRREYCPMASGGPVHAISRLLGKSAWLREYFTASVVYELRRG